MKKEWANKRLGDVCDLIGGGTPSKKNAAFYTGTIPWATVRDLSSDILTNTEHCITEDAIKNSSSNVIPGNNVVIATRVGLGKICIIRQDTAINQDLRGIIPKDISSLDVNYLFYWFKSIAKIIVAAGTGATVQGVKVPFVKSLQIPIPPLSEQEEIVEVLDKAFAAIDQAKANIEQNIANAKELFQSKLNQIFSQKGEGWVETTLKDVGIVQTGTTPPTKDRSNYGDYIPFVKPAHFRQDGSINHGDSMLSESGLSKGRLFEAHSVLMVCIGATIGKTGFTDVPVSSNQQINALTPSVDYEAKLLYYALISPFVQKQVMVTGKSAQATLPIINKSKWEKLRINLPIDISEQKEIVVILEDLKDQTMQLEAHYQTKLASLDELKKSILQKAFAGELT